MVQEFSMHLGSLNYRTEVDSQQQSFPPLSFKNVTPSLSSLWINYVLPCFFKNKIEEGISKEEV